MSFIDGKSQEARPLYCVGGIPDLRMQSLYRCRVGEFPAPIIFFSSKIDQNKGMCQFLIHIHRLSGENN